MGYTGNSAGLAIPIISIIRMGGGGAGGEEALISFTFPPTQFPTLILNL